MGEETSVRWVTESVHTVHKIKVRKGNGYVDARRLKVATEFKEVMGLFWPCTLFKEDSFEPLFYSLLRMKAGLAVYFKLKGFPGQDEVFVSGR